MRRARSCRGTPRCRGGGPPPGSSPPTSRCSRTRRSGGWRLAARWSEPSGPRRKMAPSSGFRWTKARSSTSSSSASGVSGAASARWTSLTTRRRPVTPPASPPPRGAPSRERSWAAGRRIVLPGRPSSAPPTRPSPVAGTAPPGPSTSTRLSARRMTSPGRKGVGPETGRSFRKVVFRDPRSSRNQLPSFRKNRACCRERKRSATTTSAFEERPITAESPLTSRRNGSASRGSRRRWSVLTRARPLRGGRSPAPSRARRRRGAGSPPAPGRCARRGPSRTARGRTAAPSAASRP